MNDNVDLKSRLSKLQATCERIREAMLGEDWETQLELRNLLTKVEQEIRVTVSELQRAALV